MGSRFEETVMFKKGHLGEFLVDCKILQAGKFIPYAPVGGRAHPFDRLCASKNKKNLMVVEVKTISTRAKVPYGYPDTGISIKHYEDYLHVQEKYNIPVFLVFVDSHLKEIYGNKLDELKKETSVIHRGKTLSYPRIESNFTAVGGKIIYFPLINMTHIYKLTEEEAGDLERFSNYGYEKDLEHKKGYDEWVKKKETLSSHYSF